MQCVLARLTCFGLMWALPSLRGLYRQGTTGRSVIVVLPKHTFSSKTGAIYITRPPTKALFGCVRDLVLAPPNGKPALEETPGYLGGRLCTRTGHGTSQVAAEKCDAVRKNAKTAKPPVNTCVAVPSENCTTKIAEFRFVAGSG